MATVNEVLALAEQLKTLVANKRDFQSARQGANEKAARMSAEIQSINGQIDALKAQLRLAVADME
jgi:chromosome segregation ATPase